MFNDGFNDDLGFSSFSNDDFSFTGYEVTLQSINEAEYVANTALCDSIRDTEDRITNPAFDYLPENIFYNIGSVAGFLCKRFIRNFF